MYGRMHGHTALGLHMLLQLRIYEDEDGSRKEEIADMSASNQTQLYT